MKVGHRKNMTPKFPELYGMGPGLLFTGPTNKPGLGKDVFFVDVF